MYTQQQVDSVVSVMRSDAAGVYYPYIIGNLDRERNIENQIAFIKEDLGKIAAGADLLLLIASNMDCATCIDRQINEWIKLFSVEELKNRIVLITNQSHMTMLEERWPKVVRHLNTVVLDDVQLLEKRYGYQPTKPMYVLYNRAKGSSYGTYVIDQRFAQLDEHYLAEVADFLKGR